MVIEQPNDRRMRDKSECGVVDVRCRQADDLEEFGHKAEAIGGRVEEGIDINGGPNLTSS